MPKIDVDNEVMEELQKRAIGSGRMYMSANEVLRWVLKLGPSDRPLSLGTQFSNSNEHMPKKRRTGSGSVMLKEHIDSGEIHSGVRQGYYHRDGRSFGKPREYPVAFFGPAGFVIVNSEEEFESPYFRGRSNSFSVPNGVENLPEYVQCQHSHVKQ